MYVCMSYHLNNMIHTPTYDICILTVLHGFPDLDPFDLNFTVTAFCEVYHHVLNSHARIQMAGPPIHHCGYRRAAASNKNVPSF